MGTWTTKNGKVYALNIRQDFINRMQSHGARFCWMQENKQILDENSDYFEDCGDDSNKGRTFKQDITVVCKDGLSITGYVTHWVRGAASATDQRDWFIIQPGPYPIYYNQGVYVEDL